MWTIVVTNDRLKLPDTCDVTYMNEVDGISAIESVANTKLFNYYVLDYETDGLCPIDNNPLLALLLANDTFFIIDLLSVTNFREMLCILNSRGRFANQNCKFEYTFTKAHYGLTLDVGFDVMIAFQRIFLNLRYGKADLYSIINYFFNVDLQELEHVTTTYKATIPHGVMTEEQYKYALNDVIYILPLVDKLCEVSATYENEYLLYNIEFPLISVLGDMELEGIDIDIEKHKEITEKALLKVTEYENLLDEEFRRLRALLKPKDLAIIGGKYDRVRRTQVVTQHSLFDEFVVPIEYKNTKACINWNSDKQVVEIIGLLGLVCPIKDDTDNKDLIPNDYNTDNNSFTTGEKAINEFISNNPKIEHKRLLELLLEYRGYCKQVTTYGYSFIHNINNKTKKLHTVYRQCSTRNGRLSSGGGKRLSQKPNLQNIPRSKEFRSIFTIPKDSDYLLFTADYSGAELCVMVAKSNDKALYELSLTDDLHSPIATKAWRNIYASRGDKLMYDTFLVDKQHNQDLRQVGKNMHFGCFYLMSDKTASKTLGVNRSEAELYILTMRKMFPKVFEMTEKHVDTALKFGVLEIDPVTKAKIFFSEVLNANKANIKLSYEEEKLVRGRAANIPISGTQAIFLKEAKVKLSNFYKETNLDAKLLLTVHDELVIKFNKNNEKFFVDNTLNIMKTVADKYLNGVNIKVEYHIDKFWSK